jgi:hypothetical protein
VLFDGVGASPLGVLRAEGAVGVEVAVGELVPAALGLPAGVLLASVIFPFWRLVALA